MRTVTTNSVLSNVDHELIETDSKEEVSQEDVESDEESVNLRRTALIFLELSMARLFPAKDSVEFGQDDNYDRYRDSNSHKLMSGDCRLNIRVSDRFIVTIESSLVRFNPFVEDKHGNCE